MKLCIKVRVNLPIILPVGDGGGHRTPNLKIWSKLWYFGRIIISWGVTTSRSRYEIWHVTEIMGLHSHAKLAAVQ